MSEIKQAVEILDKKKGPHFEPSLRVNTVCWSVKLDGISVPLLALSTQHEKYKAQPMAGSQDA